MLLVVNVMTMMEGVILQEIVLRPWSDPPVLRKLCFPRGKKRNFKEAIVCT